MRSCLKLIFIFIAVFISINCIVYLFLSNNHVEQRLPSEGEKSLYRQSEDKNLIQVDSKDAKYPKFRNTTQAYIWQMTHVNYLEDCCKDFSELSGYCSKEAQAVCSDGQFSYYCTCVEKDKEDERNCCLGHYGMSSYCYSGRLICNDGKLSSKCRC